MYNVCFDISRSIFKCCIVVTLLSLAHGNYIHLETKQDRLYGGDANLKTNAILQVRKMKLFKILI